MQKGWCIMSRQVIKWCWNLTPLAGYAAAANKLLEAFHCDEEELQT